MAPPGGGNIKVVVRVRPFNAREIDRRAKCIVRMEGSQTILTPPSSTDDRARGSAKGGRGEGQKVFAFDKSYWSFDAKDAHFAGQEHLFTDLGKPLLENAFEGYNNCIFAYGQTGSGKSYSMMGYREEAGVIPRICRDMFERIAELQRDRTVRCTVEVSYVEIYNERVRDLLNPATRGNLKVREHPATGPYVEDLAKLVVRSYQEVEGLMDEGNKARTVAATNMNETSSRSHAVFTLTLTQHRHDVETNMSTEKVAKINLVDLAGSERATSTGATGARLKEGAEINRSLSTLGRVIAALADLSSGKKKNMSMVPYRDSVLTWLLKDSIGGNSLTAMIAAISPADINYEETISTLRYADSAKRIKNHAVVNEDPNAKMIRELKEELAQLRLKLSGGGVDRVPDSETYAPDTPLEKQMVSIKAADGTVKQVSKAEIAEQLNQSEKLYQDLNQTWEQKLQKTERIHKEREAALEELGISIEKGFIGLHTPKKMPHLVNLSDDPLLAECLVYNLKPGTTTVGNMSSATATGSEIRLNGTRILAEHCTFENVDGVVSIVPNDNAAVMVNGIRVEKPKRLRSGYRIILGDFHIFRFNHPQEARAERAEKSLLRHSITASQLGSPGPKPINGNAHTRAPSRASSDYGESERHSSFPPSTRSSRDSDWSLARREAAHALLGPDQKVSHLTDDELDVLFEEVHRVREGRRSRPEGKSDLEDDMDSVNSFPVREKYTSLGTIDSFSIDTAITLPSTPQPNEVEERLRQVREDMQEKLEKQREAYEEKLRAVEAANGEKKEDHAPDERSEASKCPQEDGPGDGQQPPHPESPRVSEEWSEQQRQLDEAKAKDREMALARSAFAHWRQQRYVHLAEVVLQQAAMLKEAQVLSRELGKSADFQFTILGAGHSLVSSYDMVFDHISSEDDELLEAAAKPCVAVRVLDFEKAVIQVLSLDGLRKRIRLMRSMRQYLGRPEYAKHLRLAEPSSEACPHQYSLVGDVDVPLAAVFQKRVHDYMLNVISPYTFGVVGILRLSLEPSAAHAPPSMLKFNVVMHELVGFAEREGTDVHAQLCIPGTGDDTGVSTTRPIDGFDEGPIRFESVHSMSLPSSSPTTSTLKISVFAKVTAMHMDKLLSWDEIASSRQLRTQDKGTRIAESEFYSEARHDVFARIQICELADSGEYLPVEVVQNSATDAGVYQLHQGLQRRIVISLTYNSADANEWRGVSGLRVDRIRLVDSLGKVPDLNCPTPEVALKVSSEPHWKSHANGTSQVVIIAHWDSGLHESPLLDRTTASTHRVRLSLHWDIDWDRLARPMSFELDLDCQVRPRSYSRSTSKLLQMWYLSRIVHSTVGLFQVVIRPVSAKRAADLWRLNTQTGYINGEELVSRWVPRGVSLIHDFMSSRKRRRRELEVEAASGLLNRALAMTNGSGYSSPSSESPDPLVPTGRQRELLTKYLKLWTLRKDPAEAILGHDNTEPPTNGASFAPQLNGAKRPRFIAEVQHLTKNPTVLKAGYLLSPDESNTRWARRYVELRWPYLHVYGVPEGDELTNVNLSHSRIDHQPGFGRLLHRPHVFAVYAPQNTYLFAARTDRERLEWILRIDQSYSTLADGHT